MKQPIAVLAIVSFIVASACFVPRDCVAAPETIEKSFPMKAGGLLVLDLRTGGEIEIAGWSKEEVAVTAEIGGRDANEVRVEFDHGSKRLEIRSYCDKRRGCSTRMRFTINVPERFDVSIDSKGGAVEIEGVEGKIGGKTMGGSLHLARVKGSVDLRTMGGSVTVRECEADGKVSTMGGGILIEDVKGNLKGSTMGGKVVYRNVTGRSSECDDDEVSVRTMGGDIVLEKVDRDVKAKTFGGDIDVAGGKAVNVSTMGGDVNVDDAPAGATVSTMGGDITILSAGTFVKAKTMGGDIEIKAVEGWVDVSTMGGDVDVTMTGDPSQGKRDVEISSMGGEITLVVPDGLSMKFDIDLQYTKGKEGRYRIESDFPMEKNETTEWKGRWGNKRRHIYGTGTVGGGDNLIRIETVNGNIRIKKG
jgi:DUF4097 and DUF4098 domain-containing protein YvlB